MSCQTGILRGQSHARDAREAVREFHAAVNQPDTALVLFFCSSTYDLDVIADEMQRRFAGVQVVGCTTAGEIGPAGYVSATLNGASFPASHFRAVSGCIENLQSFQAVQGQELVHQLKQRLAAEPAGPKNGKCVALQLIDGLSVREEPVTRSLQSALGGTPLVGGSAGDDMGLQHTRIYFGGRFLSDTAVLVLLATPLPFAPFMTHHFEPMNERLVVTAADPARRIVYELNGRPAAKEFANILGLAERELDISHFACHSVSVLVNDESHVRSVQKINGDGSLTFFCAIERGLVLRATRSKDLLKNLEQLFSRIHAEIGPPHFILGFDCIHRRLDIECNADRDRIVELLVNNGTTGFCTYGEQYRGAHMNQTFVGVAFGGSLPVDAPLQIAEESNHA
ncbi:FIST N-terminal domain-containing protein [Propionivibrio limicola]|uniref:FIST N-terminal domain-containing protein n=1 Tax=Propionivibrio limicola TaxID=167645 RepID=UPI001290CE9D|nr:FIST N-terminal domain-containing protein [Propionivibrio limicola]